MALPVLLVADADVELNNTIAIWEGFSGKALVPGQPDYLLAANLAYNKYLMLERCNAAFINTLLSYASAPALDYIVELIGVTRTSAQPATCSLRFTLVTGHGTLTISAGTRVSSTDGKAVFEVDQDTLVDASIDDVTVNATCQTDGIIGNGYAAGTVTTIMDVQPYLSACENTDVTAGGVDTETDEELRARAKLAPSSFSVAGPRDAYIYHTKTVSPLICDVEVVTMSEDITVAPGEVDVYPLLDRAQVPSGSMLSLIEAHLSADTIRPLTDTVVVLAPTQRTFDIGIDLTKLSTYSGTAAQLIDKVTEIMQAYKVEKYSKLGQDIVASEIEAICRIEGLYDVFVTIVPGTGSLTGRNLVLSRNEFAYMDILVVNVIGSHDA